MVFGTLVDKVKNFRSRSKVTFDKWVDPALFWLGSNAAYAYAADKTLDQVSQNTDTNEGLAMFGTYAGLTAGLYLVNRFIINPLTRKIREHHTRKSNARREVGAGSIVRTTSQIGAIALAAYIGNFPATVNNFRWDGERIVGAFARDKSPENLEREEELQDSTRVNHGLANFNCSNTEEIRNSNRLTPYGKFLRAARWQKTFAEVEKKYSIEPGLVAALAMRESYGNPLELNEGNDGGAGLMMFQPGTARRFGLKVYGDSNASGRDRNHGVKLRKFVEKNGWDYATLATVDHRFDVRKSADAAARYLKEEKNNHGSWDKALSAYNQGTPAPNPKATRHVSAVREYQKVYLDGIRRCR